MTTPLPPSRPPSSPAPGPRAPRGRLLLVGDDVLPPAVRDRLRTEPVCVANVFEAIGELSHPAPRGPIVATVVDDRVVHGRTAEALRRIDPSVHLIVVRGRASEGTPDTPERRADGFDDRLDSPVDPDDLGRLLGEEWIMPSSASPVAPPSSPAEPERAAAIPATGPAPGAVTLGDTDLVDALINDPGGVTATAVALVREHTGWTDLDLGDVETALPRGRAGAEVRTEQGVIGTLVTGMAADRELAPWARWLGQWLTLDHAYRTYRAMAFRDDLTGSWNRRYFARFLGEVLPVAARRRRPITVMVFDIDDFKRYNDEFGHEAGDVILRETVSLLNSVIRTCDRVCRIGGDEFAVVFADLDLPRAAGSHHPESVETIALRFQEQIRAMRFPKLGLEAPGTLSISAGLSSYPWDGLDAATLLRLADRRALESKRKGKNHITFGPAATRSSAR